jgi:hypothetical protein
MAILPLLVDLRVETIFPPHLVAGAVDDVLGAIKRNLGESFHDQGGISLDLIDSPSIKEMLDVMVAKFGLPTDPRLCSARLQRPDGCFRLPWHQDWAPMDLQRLVKEFGPVKARVCWVPLTPVDGRRPSLEVAEPAAPNNHLIDDRQFLYLPDYEAVGTILKDAVAGTCWSFSPFAPHRTWVTPTMTEDRISLDLRFCEAW